MLLFYKPATTAATLGLLILVSLSQSLTSHIVMITNVSAISIHNYKYDPAPIAPSPLYDHEQANQAAIRGLNSHINQETQKRQEEIKNAPKNDATQSITKQTKDIKAERITALSPDASAQEAETARAEALVKQGRSDEIESKAMKKVVLGDSEPHTKSNSNSTLNQNNSTNSTSIVSDPESVPEEIHISKKSPTTQQHGTNKPLTEPNQQELGSHHHVDSFMAHCVQHFKTLTTIIDREYTHSQAQNALEDQCKLAATQPSVYDDGFMHRSSCLHFAQQVANARTLYLENGGDGKQAELGFERVCSGIWLDQNPIPISEGVQKKTVGSDDDDLLIKSDHDKLQLWMVASIFGAGLVSVFVVNFVLVKS